MRIMDYINLDYAVGFLREHQQALSFIAPIIPTLLFQQWIYQGLYKKMEKIEPKERICGRCAPVMVGKGNTEAEQQVDIKEKQQAVEATHYEVKKNQEKLDLKTERRWTIKTTGISLAITIPVYAISVLACQLLAKKYL